MTTRRSQSVLLPFGVGLAAAAFAVVGALDDPRRAMLGYIAAYALGAATVVAAMVLTMALVVVDAKWWLVLRRVFLSVVGVVPLLALLFLPILVGYARVYPWANRPPDLSLETTEALEHQAAWNHPSFFFGRSALYLVTWSGLSVLLRRALLVDDGAPAARRARALAAMGIPLLAFTFTFASFDWLMSLAAGFTSNVFGVYVFTSGLVAALAVIAVGSWLALRAELAPGVMPDNVSAVGRLLLMAVILWAYIGFFQFVLAWIADLPPEAGFYVARAHGAWGVVDVILVVGRFFVPFVLLLSRPLKRSASKLAAVALWLIATTILEFAWIVFPSLGVAPGAADVLPFVAVGGLLWAAGSLLFARHERAGEAAASPAPPEALRYRSP